MPWRAPATGVAFLCAACASAWVLYNQFGAIPLASVGVAVHTQPASKLILSLGLTALSFLCLSLYDVVGVRLVAARRVPTSTALLAGATGNALSNTLGFHAVTGSVVRAHVYRRFGLTTGEVARIVSLAWLALGLGFVTMFAAAELLRSTFEGPPNASLWVGVAICAGLSAFVIWLARGPRELSVFGFKHPLPCARLAIAQMCIGAVESGAAVGALYVLLPVDLAPPFGVFAVGSIAAVTLGLVAHAPGGIGVFEASVTAMLAGAGRADLLASLVLYRAIYNLLPFTLSIGALALLQFKRRNDISLTAGIF